MLATSDLADIVATVSYKPGWELLVREIDPHQGPYLSILVTLPDSYNPGQTVPLRIHSPIPPMTGRTVFMTWLAWRLKAIETHEMLEWFKVDGKPWIDPHTGLD